MIRNNFEQIKSIVSFDPDYAFAVDIIQRRKDIPNLDVTSRLVTSFLVTSEEGYERRRRDIIPICDALGARAMINLNRVNLKKVALECNYKVGQLLKHGSYKAVKTAYKRSLGVSGVHDKGHRYWMIDWDGEEVEECKLSDVRAFLGENLIEEIKSNSGRSLIIKPHDTRALQLKFNSLVLYKNSPVNLYIPTFSSRTK